MKTCGSAARHVEFISTSPRGCKGYVQGILRRAQDDAGGRVKHFGSGARHVEFISTSPRGCKGYVHEILLRAQDDASHRMKTCSSAARHVEFIPTSYPMELGGLCSGDPETSSG